MLEKTIEKNLIPRKLGIIKRRGDSNSVDITNQG
jgi:hypothetical protein